MMLEICKEKFLFSIFHIKYMDILCYFIIFLCILLCLIIKNNRMVQKNNIMNSYLIFISSLLFLSFIIITIVFSINKYRLEGCYCKLSENFELEPVTNFDVHSLKDISNNKVIVVGDSRMEYIERDRNELDIPVNFSFIAKSGSKVDWFEKKAKLLLIDKLENLDNNYDYHVVVNMGVNDIDDQIDIEERSSRYFSNYKILAQKYPNVKFYILSVNPINENVLNKRLLSNQRSNQKIIRFNNKMNSLLKESDMSNVYSCDSYHTVSFNLPDGLHFDHKTDQNILDYISNKCINYN